MTMTIDQVINDRYRKIKNALRSADQNTAEKFPNVLHQIIPPLTKFDGTSKIQPLTRGEFLFWAALYRDCEADLTEPGSSIYFI